MTFATVGNARQPFPRFLDAIGTLAAEGLLPRPILVQVGVTRWSGPSDCETFDFILLERFERAMADAEIVISHAGAGSIIHALVAGHRPIVMPRERERGEIVDDHQLELAARLSVANLVYAVRDQTALRTAVRHAITERPRPSVANSRLVSVVARCLDDVMFGRATQ